MNWEGLIAALDDAPDGDRRRAFVRWVEGRFYSEARAGRRFEVVDAMGTGHAVGEWVLPVFSGGGWERWEVSGLWAEPDAGLWADVAYVRMVRVEENDRSTASRGPAVAFGLQVLFGPPPG